MIRKASPDTHQECRSLLQKAVRRGCSDLIARVACHLDEIGDRQWLRGRVGVITFEECWPLGLELESQRDNNHILQILNLVGRSVKQKDAAGLGSLAYEVSKGNPSLTEDSKNNYSLKIIANAIDRPNEFWIWLLNKPLDEEKKKFVLHAKASFSRGGWPWDRAFMQAAAYLAVIDDIPEAKSANIQETNILDFPFWIAIDKHTAGGKEAIKIVAERTGNDYRKISWLFFYFASAITNQVEPSYWWNREMTWRLNEIGFSTSTAEDLWNRILPVVQEVLAEKADKLKTHVLNDMREPSQEKPTQLNLF